MFLRQRRDGGTAAAAAAEGGRAGWRCTGDRWGASRRARGRLVILVHGAPGNYESASTSCLGTFAHTGCT